MTSERVMLSDVTNHKISSQLERFGIALGNRDFSDITTIIEQFGDDDDHIETWTTYPRLPRDVIAFIVPTTHWNINVKKTSIVLAAAIIDALATGGLLSAGLSLTGMASRGIARLDADSGEFCCLVHSKKLQADEAPISPAIVHQFISGKPCPFAKFNCNLMRGAACDATVPAVEKLFDSLEKKGALEKKDSEWTIPF